MLIFLLQSIWLYISELAGKDLDVEIIGKFLLYVSPNLIPMVLPLTILVASIMTFGGFSEHYEFAAMKSSGISLQRAMRSLILFIGVLSVTTFFFANDVIPWSQYKSINLRNNIRKLKPALAIVQGSFNQVGDYNIKVKKKTGENGQNLHDVIIHKKIENQRGMTVIKAKSGKLEGNKSSDILSLILYDGNQYQRTYPKDFKERLKRPFIKNNFKEYKFNIDLSSFNDVDLDDEKYNNSEKMLDVSELRVSLDSLSRQFNQDQKNFTKTLMSRNGTEKILKNDIQVKKFDKPKLKLNKFQESKPKDTVIYAINDMNGFYNSYDVHKKLQMANLALSSIRGTVSTINGKKKNFSKKAARLNKTEIQIHDKFALAIMCYILFFVGAPLGAIIRKGGIGLPMVVAILLFLTYYYIGIFAKNSAEDGSISPFLATWLSTFIMLPLSVIVTYRATTDQGIFNPNIIISPIRKLFAKIGLVKKKKKEEEGSQTGPQTPEGGLE